MDEIKDIQLSVKELSEVMSGVDLDTDLELEEMLASLDRIEDAIDNI